MEFTLDHTGDLVDRVDSGDIDLAVFGVKSTAKRESDIELWVDDLVWVTSAACSFSEGTVPILDFGLHCIYNEFTHKTLTDAGIDHRRVFSAASSADVRAAVQAGIGIAAMSSRYLGDDVVEWQPPVPVAKLPQMIQVIRSVPGERQEAVAALIATIESELRCHPSFA